MKRLLALALSLGLAALTGAAPAVAQSSDEQVELQIGQQEYQALQQKGEIIPSSPYYAILNPIAQQIKRVSDPQYFHPFKFILVHEKQPNAFAVPGGNVYVTDALMSFVQNREELAGVLCHETSHTIHHDVLNLYKKAQHTATTYTIVDILANIATNGRAANTIGTASNILFTVQTQGFSRDVERAADLKGSDTCAEAGVNPWGLVWLLQAFEKADAGGSMEILSDHPTNQHRIADLTAHMQSEPQLFARYSANIATATPVTGGARRTATTASTAALHPVKKKGKGMFPPGSGYKY
jgi:predicted Zn-dependent protease